MKTKRLFKLCSLLSMLITSFNANAIGWDKGNSPGAVVGVNYNGSRERNISPEMELQDQLLTVYIFSYKNTDKIWQCTGTLYDQDKVLTAGHCISDSYLISPPKFGEAINPERDIFVRIYTPQVLNLPGSSILKFSGDRVFQANARYLDIWGNNVLKYAEPEYYETIKVKKILPINSDAIVLKLEKSPEIVDTHVVSPLSQIRIASYRREAALTARKEYATNLSDKAEVMGFAPPLESNIQSIARLQQPEKAFFNLRSVNSGIPFARANFYCQKSKKCFQYVFNDISVDDGDSGGPFYFYDNSLTEDPERIHKKLLGAISGAEFIPLKTRTSPMKGYYVNYIQGFSDDDIELINNFL